MTVPHEFTAERVAEQCGDDAFRPYHPFLRSGEPYRSIVDNNPWLKPPSPSEEIGRTDDRYYNTTVARKHDYWSNQPLPEPSKDMQRLRRDLYEWGYCLIDEGLSEHQYRHMRARLAEQAEAERIAGMAYMGPSFQILWALVNKGECFVAALEHDPEWVQSGPLIERLLHETLGGGFYALSFASNIAFPGCLPQGLHQDQGMISPFQTPEAPVLVNTMYILEDVDEVNGGTLIIPGSHRLVSEAGSGKPVGKLPPAINVEARAGTVMMFDGRLLHGTGANRSDEWRFVMTQANVKSWIRQQENWALLVAPEVLASASDKLLQRLGLQATGGAAMVEGFGMLGSGRAGDPRGDISRVRREIDAGTYRRVGRLTPDEARALAPDTYSLQSWQAEGEKRGQESRS